MAPTRRLLTLEQLNKAKELIRNGLTAKAAATLLGVNAATLRKRIRLNSVATSFGRSPTFTRQQEDNLWYYLWTYDMFDQGMRMITIRKWIYEYAEVNYIPHPFNKRTRMPSRDWVIRFAKRRPDLLFKIHGSKNLL